MYLLSSQTRDINFIDSIFKNNSAEYGGALAFDNLDAYGSYIADNNFINSTFDSNSAVDGGAIYIIGQASENGIIGVVFVNNTASSNGGAVYLIGENNVIDASQFDENTAVFGGAVYLDKNS